MILATNYIKLIMNFKLIKLFSNHSASFIRIIVKCKSKFLKSKNKYKA